MIWALGIYAVLATLTCAWAVSKRRRARADVRFWEGCSARDLHALQQWKTRAIVAEASLSRCIVARDAAVAELAKSSPKRGAGGRFVA